MTKRKKILICCILAALLTIVTIIPAFAINISGTTIPGDIGDEITNEYNHNMGLFYLEIYCNSDETINLGQIIINYGDYSTTFNIRYEVNNIGKFIRISSTNEYSWIYTLNVLNRNYNGLIYFDNLTNKSYIAIGVYSLYPSTTHWNVNQYNTGVSYIKTYKTIQVSSYNDGYNNGYNDGYTEGFNTGTNGGQYTNLTEYVEELLSRFVGIEHARYLTPISIVLVILLVYFLFVRFLLSLVKAKGIIKTCDIIMIVACIIMLVVMYAPMLDLTIKTEQTTTSEETTEAVRIDRSNIFIETTETGDIYYGPVGTAIVTKNETIEDIYKISEDIETEAIAYEKD